MTSTWEKPTIERIQLNSVTKGGNLSGNDGGGEQTGEETTATS